MTTTTSTVLPANAPSTVNAFATRRGDWDMFISRCFSPSWRSPTATKQGHSQPSPITHPLAWKAITESGELVADGTAPIGNSVNLMQTLLLDWQASQIIFSTRTGTPESRTFDIMAGWLPEAVEPIKPKTIRKPRKSRAKTPAVEASTPF